MSCHSVTNDTAIRNSNNKNSRKKVSIPLNLLQKSLCSLFISCDDAICMSTAKKPSLVKSSQLSSWYAQNKTYLPSITIYMINCWVYIINKFEGACHWAILMPKWLYFWYFQFVMCNRPTINNYSCNTKNNDKMNINIQYSLVSLWIIFHPPLVKQMKGGNNILSSDLLSQVPLTNHQGPQSCSDLYEQVVFPAKSTLQNPHYILKQTNSF